VAVVVEEEEEEEVEEEEEEEEQDYSIIVAIPVVEAVAVATVGWASLMILRTRCTVPPPRSSMRCGGSRSLQLLLGVITHSHSLLRACSMHSEMATKDNLAQVLLVYN
jgi:hypothetical protein